MDPMVITMIGVTLFALSIAYSSIGHGGASGYIAFLALFGLVPEVIRPAALTFNIVVAGIAVARFGRAGFIEWSAVLPIIFFSVPFAFIGGMFVLEDSLYRMIVGTLLLISAGYLTWQSLMSEDKFQEKNDAIPVAASVTAGAGIGFISGLSGIGGGVLLSPIFLIAGWAGARQTAGIAAVFILANSIAGLSGNLVAVRTLPSEVFFWSVCTLIGAVVGTSLGTSRLPVQPLLWILVIAVSVSGLKYLIL